MHGQRHRPRIDQQLWFSLDIGQYRGHVSGTAVGQRLGLCIEDCDEDGVYEFFFCGPPLIITGGTGSPINPQAIK